RRGDVGDPCDRKGLDPRHPQQHDDHRDNDRRCWSIKDVCEYGLTGRFKTSHSWAGLGDIPWRDSTASDATQKAELTAGGRFCRDPWNGVMGHRRWQGVAVPPRHTQGTDRKCRFESFPIAFSKRRSRKQEKILSAWILLGNGSLASTSAGG